MLWTVLLFLLVVDWSSLPMTGWGELTEYMYKDSIFQDIEEVFNDALNKPGDNLKQTAALARSLVICGRMSIDTTSDTFTEISELLIKLVSKINDASVKTNALEGLH